MEISANCKVTYMVEKTGQHGYEEETHKWFNVTLNKRYKALFLRSDNDLGKSRILQGFLQSPVIDKILLSDLDYERGIYKLTHRTVEVTHFNEGHDQFEEEPEEYEEYEEMEVDIPAPKPVAKKKKKATKKKVAKKKVVI